MTFQGQEDSVESYLEPLFLWRPEYESPEKLEEVVLRICAMLDSACYFYNRWGKRNNVLNYDIYNGVVNPESYRSTTHIFADSFPAELQPFDFFSSPVNVLVGELTASPLKFSVEVINREAAERDIERKAKMAAQALVRSGQEQASEKVGHDLSFMKDRSVYIPSTPEEMANFMNEKSENEKVVYDMMQYVMYRHDIEHELAKSFKDRAIINSEFGEVSVRDGNPIFKRLHPSNVSWLGGGDDIETLDDCDAVCSYKYLSFSELITKHGHKMKHSGKFDVLKKQVSTIMREGGDFGRVLGEWQNDGTVILNTPTLPHHYRYNSSTGVAIAEQTVYIKFVKTKRFKMTVDGSPLPDDVFNAMKRGEMWRIANLEDIQYEPLDEKYQAKAADTIKVIPYVELWTATRLGTDYLMEIRKSPFQNRKEENRVNVSFPIKGRINQEPSMLTKGLPIYNMFMRIMYQLQRQVNLSGLKTVFVDSAQMPKDWDMNTFLYSAKAVGLGVFNSQQAMGTQNPNLQNKHLTTVDWGLNDDITRLLQLSVLMSDMYAQVSGVAMARQGYIKPGEGVGQSQQAQVQSSLITQPMFYEHSLFTREVLQEIADMGRYLWAKDESKAVIIGKYGKKVLRLSRDLKLDEYGIFVTDSYRDRKDKEFLMAMGERAMSTSGINFRDLIKMYYSDNPSEVESIFDDGLSRLEKMEEQARTQQNQVAQQQVEVDAQKIQVPIEVAKINAEAMLKAKEMDLDYKAQHDANSFEYKENQGDIKNQSALDMEGLKQQHDAAMAGAEAEEEQQQQQQGNQQETALELMKQYFNAQQTQKEPVKGKKK